MTRTFDQSPSFPEGARVSLANPQLRTNLSRATTTIRNKRNLRVAELDNWEDLRLAAESIKEYSLAHLDDLLQEFERNVTAAGGVVHWARTSAEACEIVLKLVQATGATDVVKIKSMTTAEVELNPVLEQHGITAYETDLAELIVQLGDDLPSHIVVPAIHRNRDEVQATFREHMGEWGRPAPDNLSNAPEDLANAARLHLRERFLSSSVGISGANFLVAETGSVAIVESEGNGRMCLTLPSTLISIAGVDKIIPRFEDLEVFFQLLPRSATGERMNPYNSVWSGITPGDGPQNFHVVLLDNGRTSALSNRVGRQALRCIRCAACLNVCPVYEQVGGHAYGSVYPGPIGAVLTPQLDHVASEEVAASLPFASTLCGACFDACPVRIDIPKLLVHLRGEIVDAQRGRFPKNEEQAVMRMAAWIFDRPSRLQFLANASARLTRFVDPSRIPVFGWLGGWTKYRRAPLPRMAAFSSWWSRQGRPLTSRALPTRARTGRHPRAPHSLGLGASSATPSSSDSRSAILNSIAVANAGGTSPVITRDYRRHQPHRTTNNLDLFVDRVRDYHAGVHLSTEAQLSSDIVRVLAAHGSQSVIVPDQSLAPLLEQFSGTVTVDNDISLVALDATDSVVTTCTAAIAETGTVILNGGIGEGRRVVSLIPDHHVVIVRASQIVTDVPDVMQHLSTTRPQTWFSGPSATSDIELNRVEGVHGPRNLDVIIVS